MLGNRWRGGRCAVALCLAIPEFEPDQGHGGPVCGVGLCPGTVAARGDGAGAASGAPVRAG